MKKIKLIITVIFLLLIIQINILPAEFIKETKITSEALFFWKSGTDVTAFGPLISCHGDCIDVVNGYVFAAWYKGGMSNRHLMVSRLKIGTNNWETLQLPDKNTLYSGGSRDGMGDSHRTAAIAVCTIDNTIHLAYDMHADRLQYRISKKQAAFGSVWDSSIFNNEQSTLNSADTYSRVTYPQFIRNNEGGIILNVRDGGGAGSGDHSTIYYNGNSWSRRHRYAVGAHSQTSEKYSLYGGFNFYNDKIYYCTAMRDKVTTDRQYNFGIFFADAGTDAEGSFKNIIGVSKSLPITSKSTWLNTFKVAEPVANSSQDMTSSPRWVVTKNGYIHATVKVNGSGGGYQHWIGKIGSANFTKYTSGVKDGYFFTIGNKVYVLDNSNPYKIYSAEEGTNNWNLEYTDSSGRTLQNKRTVFYNGNLYVLCLEKKSNTDKLPMYLHEIKIVNETKLPPNISITSPSNNSIFYEGDNIEFSANADDPDGEIDKVDFFVDSELVFTERVLPYSRIWTAAPGTHILKAAAYDKDGLSKTSSEITINVQSDRFNIPGTIEAEDYHDYNDTTPGNQGGAYRNDDADIQDCNEGGYNVGWIADTEWLEYNVNVASSGNYKVECRAASKTNNIKYNILQGQTVIASVDSPSTGDWQSWKTINSVVNLTGGQSSIRIAMTGGSWNLNWIKITKINDTPLGPVGYTYCCMEGESYTFTNMVDVAYGANGQFVYEYGLTGTVTFNNARFGDPIHGVRKAGFYKNSSGSSSSSSSSNSSSSSSSSSNITILTNIDKDKVYSVNGVREFQIPTGVSGILQVKKPWQSDVQFSINGGAYQAAPEDWGGEFSVPANSNIKVKVKTPSAMDVQFNWW